MDSVRLKPMRVLLAFAAVGAIALTVPNPPTLPLQNSLAEILAIWESNES